MALTTADIKRRITAASWSQKDDEARNIINGATSDELKSLDAEGVLRLYEVLISGLYSLDDAASMTTLKNGTQFQPVTNTPDYGVDLVVNAKKTKNQNLVTARLVTNIYAAEDKRLSTAERMGWDGDTIGRGQLGQLAYTDVKTRFKSELQECVTQVFIAKLLAAPPPQYSHLFDFSTYAAIIPDQYSAVILHPPIEDFVVAAYLAIRIDAATKAGRSHPDTLKFAVAVYHGMFKMVSAAQTAAKDDVNWTPVEAQLLAAGHTDEVAYVNEAVK
jgi:hypothetical protein